MNPLYQKTTPDNSRGLMAVLWGDSLQAYVSNDPAVGVRVKNDFEQFSPTGLTGTTTVTNEGGWSACESVTTGGTYSVTDAGIKGGQVLIASNSTTADQGVEFGTTMRSLVSPKATTDPSTRLIAQFRLDPVTVNGQILAVLTDAAMSTRLCGANDAIADVGYIGFQVDEDGDLNFVSKSAAAGTSDSVEVLENADFDHTAVNVIGFKVDQDYKVTIAVNGKSYPAKAAQISSSAIPTGVLGVRLCCTTSGTTAASMRADAVDCFAQDG